MTDTESLIILSAIPFMGPIRVKCALAHFGSPQAALEGTPAEITALFGEKIAAVWNQWQNSPLIDKNFELISRFNARTIPFTSDEYPLSLLELHDHPIVLYVRGEIKPVDRRSIAVIGTRDGSIYGREMAEKISQELTESGFTVVSGLARGIDTCAHIGALSHGRTIAVIGSGLANLYPRENSKLADRVAEQGVLISEFPMATPPDRQNFPQRNRIVSGLSLGTLLIEAPIKSGAILTMELALRQGKKLFALPGRADQESFRGNHDWIKRNKAQLVENAFDIANQFDPLLALKQKAMESTPSILLEPEERELLKLLPSTEVQMETIAVMTKLPASRLNVLLMGLLLKKAVKEYPGKIYRKCVHI